MMTVWEVFSLAAATALLFAVVVRSAVKESPRMDGWDHLMLIVMLVTFVAGMWRQIDSAFHHVAESFF